MRSDSSTELTSNYGGTTGVSLAAGGGSSSQGDGAGNSAWYISRGSTQNFSRQKWGLNGDVPVTGGYDRDGKTDLALLRRNYPTAGLAAWYIERVLVQICRRADNERHAPLLIFSVHDRHFDRSIIRPRLVPHSADG